MTKLYSIGLGIGTRNRNDEWLEVYYPLPVIHPESTLSDAVLSILGNNSGNRNID